MKKIILVACLALSLSGCATLGTVALAGQKACDSQDSIRIALNLALTQAFTISDQSRRNMIEAGLRLSLKALEACPGPL